MVYLIWAITFQRCTVEDISDVLGYYNMEHTDDITKPTSDSNGARNYDIDADVKLHENGLKINNSKTEKYTINRKTHTWKKCKLLGTMLDTKSFVWKQWSYNQLEVESYGVIYKANISLMDTNKINGRIDQFFPKNSCKKELFNGQKPSATKTFTEKKKHHSLDEQN